MQKTQPAMLLVSLHVRQSWARSLFFPVRTISIAAILPNDLVSYYLISHLPSLGIIRTLATVATATASIARHALLNCLQCVTRSYGCLTHSSCTSFKEKPHARANEKRTTIVNKDMSISFFSTAPSQDIFCSFIANAFS